MFFKPLSDLFDPEALIFNAKHQLNDLVSPCSERIPVLFDEGVHRLPGSALVSIYKGMVEDKGVPQRRRFGKEIPIELFSSKGGTGTLNRGV